MFQYFIDDAPGHPPKELFWSAMVAFNQRAERANQGADFFFGDTP
jgi:hypothetical protein